MQKVIFILLVVLTALFTSCKKSDPSPSYANGSNWSFLTQGSMASINGINFTPTQQIVWKIDSSYKPPVLSMTYTSNSGSFSSTIYILFPNSTTSGTYYFSKLNGHKVSLVGDSLFMSAYCINNDSPKDTGYYDSGSAFSNYKFTGGTAAVTNSGSNLLIQMSNVELFGYSTYSKSDLLFVSGKFVK